MQSSGIGILTENPEIGLFFPSEILLTLKDNNPNSTLEPQLKMEGAFPSNTTNSVSIVFSLCLIGATNFPRILTGCPPYALTAPVVFHILQRIFLDFSSSQVGLFTILTDEPLSIKNVVGMPLTSHSTVTPDSIPTFVFKLNKNSASESEPVSVSVRVPVTCRTDLLLLFLVLQTFAKCPIKSHFRHFCPLAGHFGSLLL